MIAAICAVLAVLLVIQGPVRLPVDPAPASAPVSLRQRHAVLAIAAGGGAWFVIGGTVGVVAAVASAAAAWAVLTRSEPASLRHEREAAARELPHLVDLLGSTLRSGAEPMTSLEVVCGAMPGPAARRLAPVLARAQLGDDDAWASVAADDVLAPLGRALARSQRTGAPVVDMVDRLAEELEREANAALEDRARRVGVAAAVPLGICLLPAFMLLGIVPTVAALLSSIAQ